MNKNHNHSFDFITKERVYQTLSSVANSPEYSIFKPLIEFTDNFYKFALSDDFEKSSQFLIDTIENIDEYTNLSLYYCIKTIFHFIYIYPKHRKTAYQIIMFLNKLKNPLIEIKSNIEAYQKYTLSYQFPPELISEFKYLTSEEIDSFADIYPRNTLELYIKNDDINSLKNFINNHSDFADKYSTIEDYNSPLADVVKNGSQYRFDILDFCAFYGSHKCLKFLFTNGFKLHSLIANYSIAGNNIELIHFVERNGVVFDSCFETSIQYHHIELSEWLLSNYKCELFPLSNCIHYCDYRALLFLLLNGMISNDPTNFPPLYLLCQEEKVNADAIHLLLEKGCDPN